jgi:hypothetical protein
VTYEYWAGCRGTNVGAALRDANFALTGDPAETRTEGAVWVMVMLSDGAAGASDPARRHGERLTAPRPYDRVDGNAGAYRYGGTQRGNYGFFGVCPIGDFRNGANEPGELLDINDDGGAGGSATFPYCSDEQPNTRNFCTPTQRAMTGGDSSVGAFGPNAALDVGFGPGAVDLTGTGNLEADIANGAVYDIDIGDYYDEPSCSIFYDVDDYARDWADFIAGIRPGADDNFIADNSTLPTIFTIGFGLEFEDVDGDGTVECNENVESCLGEELMRYIADAGDNFQIDTDYQQDYLDDGALNGSLLPEEYGRLDPCEPDDGGYDPTNGNVAFRTHGESCGNYFNAPGQAELEDVFEEIASRMFTRITG